MIETVERPCMVCGDPVECDENMPEDEVVLCPIHYFAEDLSEEWEAGDGTVEG